MMPSADQGTPSGAKGRYALKVVVVSLIAAGAVVLGVCIISSNISSQETDRPPRASQALRFKCTAPKCGQEFAMTKSDYSAWAARVKPQKENLERAECPKCGGKFTGVLMSPCPKCNKYFVTKQVINVEKADLTERRCPHCNEILNTAPRRPRQEQRPQGGAKAPGRAGTLESPRTASQLEVRAFPRAPAYAFARRKDR